MIRVLVLAGGGLGARMREQPLTYLSGALLAFLKANL